MNRWVNFLSLLPGTVLTILIISVAFLRVYDETDFTVLGYVANTRTWSNRGTVAAILVALVGFCVEWDRRNREAARIANERAEAREAREEEARRRESADARAANERAEERQRSEEEARRRESADARAANERAEERERAARRARIQNRWILLQARYLLDPGAEFEAAVGDFVQFLQEYGEL
jgi:flagellar biosynthesis GTPase FlhF